MNLCRSDFSHQTFISTCIAGNSPKCPSLSVAWAPTGSSPKMSVSAGQAPVKKLNVETIQPTVLRPRLQWIRRNLGYVLLWWEVPVPLVAQAAIPFVVHCQRKAIVNHTNFSEISLQDEMLLPMPFSHHIIVIVLQIVLHLSVHDMHDAMLLHHYFFL